MKEQDRAKREQWRERVAQWRASGKSAAEFGRELGVRAHVVYWWSRKLKEQVLVPAKTQPRSATAIAFMPLRTAASISDVQNEPLEVVVQGGRRVRVPDGFSATTLQQVVRAIEEIR